MFHTPNLLYLHILLASYDMEYMSYTSNFLIINRKTKDLGVFETSPWLGKDLSVIHGTYLSS